MLHVIELHNGVIICDMKVLFCILDSLEASHGVQPTLKGAGSAALPSGGAWLHMSSEFFLIEFQSFIHRERFVFEDGRNESICILMKMIQPRVKYCVSFFGFFSHYWIFSSLLLEFPPGLLLCFLFNVHNIFQLTQYIKNIIIYHLKI